MLPEKVRSLEVDIGDASYAGQLLKTSVYEFRYLEPDPEQATVALLMSPKQKLTWQDGDLFAPMDQNLPEGDLFMRIRELLPKQPMTPMHLLALAGRNGIGRLGYRLPGMPDVAAPRAHEQVRTTQDTVYPRGVRRARGRLPEHRRWHCRDAAQNYGARPTHVPIPSLIVKAASPSYPALAANEFLCLSAARRAGIQVPEFSLSDDGQMLILERFDVVTHDDGRIERLGFEDIAALAGLRVRDVLSDRKYQGSYQRVAELLRQLQLHSDNLHRFFEQVALCIMVRNGDAHLKNFGVLYRSEAQAWLAPLFDVVTTSVYRYMRYQGGPELEDKTLALKLFAGRRGSKAYPTVEELHDFGRRVCGVSQPAQVLERIAQAMRQTLLDARQDARVPASLLQTMEAAWQAGLHYSL